MNHPSRFLAAAVQMCSGADKQANLAAAARLVEQAAAAGARLVALPELFNCFGTFDKIVAAAEPIPGPTSQILGELAAAHRLILVGGSIAERDELTGKTFNTSLTFGDDGRLLHRYRKMHLAAIDLPGRATLSEARWIAAGDELATAATPLGQLGVAICYDLRFPELFRRLSTDGAQIIALPSAFTHATGRDHWEVLLRARAIENQVYVVSPNQSGEQPGVPRSFGHSMMIDPWGDVLARADAADGEKIVFATIDLDRLAQIRAQSPALAQRRLC